MGHRPSHVESAEAALAEVVMRRYDLVVCDVTLPGMGIERLYESIRASDPQLPARFVAVGDPGPKLDGVPCLALPVDVARVQEAVAGALREAGSG
jgi:DNA-binding NtrC family response regulator